MRRKLDEIGFEPLVRLPLNPNMRMPPTIAHRIPANLHRHMPRITNTARLLPEKPMMTMRRKQNEQSPPADVLHVRLPEPLPPRPRPLGEVYAVPSYKLRVHCPRILALWNPAHHVEEVTIPDIRHRKLLNEALKGRCLTPVRALLSTVPSHLTRLREKGSRLFKGTTEKAAQATIVKSSMQRVRPCAYGTHACA